jgi:hypothetical protein
MHLCCITRLLLAVGPPGFTKRDLRGKYVLGGFTRIPSSHHESEKKGGTEEQKPKVPKPISRAMDERKGVISVRVWRRLFIARALEEIKMKEPEKTEIEDARSGKKGNI